MPLEYGNQEHAVSSETDANSPNRAEPNIEISTQLHRNAGQIRQTNGNETFLFYFQTTRLLSYL